MVPLPSELCSRWRSLALSTLKLGHLRVARVEPAPLALLPLSGKEAAFQYLRKSEPAWHRPGEPHLFWSWKRETNHNPEAEPCLHSPSGFSVVLPVLGGSVLMLQSPLCNDAKAKPDRGTGAGGVTSALQSLPRAEDGAGNELTAQKAGHLLGFIAAFVQCELLGSTAGELSCLVTA